MSMKKILVLGGSGFVGSVLASRLAAAGATITLPCRRRERRKALTVLPHVELIEADIHDEATLTRLAKGCDAVINLVGILHSSSMKTPYSADFERAHVTLPGKIVAACRAAGVRRLIHMSALKADPAGPSEYLASKGDGERLIRAAANDLQITIFRPSVIFGNGDEFLNTFVRIHRLAPFFPLGFGQSRLQPVWVGDVAKAFVDCLDNVATYGQSYDLCGPKVYTLRELVEYAATLAGRRAPVIPLCKGLARLQAGLLWLAPKPLLSPDNLRSLQVDNVCTSSCPVFPGWMPSALEEIAPTIIAPEKSRLDQLRALAGR